ncbi:MAG: hypothetical protein Q8Q62_18230 [Mesorhizobium sp.]|nr:hypothetical protein [Mesorhizobium sp.]
MRTVVTLLLALVASWLAGSLAGVVLAEWADGDESFILIFMSVPIVSIMAAAVFLIAGTRAVPARAINRAALALVMLTAILLASFSVFEFFINGTVASAWRGIQLMIGMAGAWLAVVVAQWAIFLWRAHSAAPPAMQFGRLPEGTE